MFVFTLRWIQGLIVFVVLAESWIACQDAEVLLESPSAMAGVHIAEALSTCYPLLKGAVLTERLDIPYFRTFTMPWTKYAHL